MEVLAAATGLSHEGMTRRLYEHEFPDWFGMQASGFYAFNWDRILPELRNGQFFFATHSYFPSPGWNITGEYLTARKAQELGELLIESLAVFSAILPNGRPVTNALELDGFAVDAPNLRLIPLEGPVSAQAEEDALTAMVKQAGIADTQAVLKHIADANSLYTEGKYHPSLNESRSLIQCLIDDIGEDTHRSGSHTFGFPGGTSNRIDYLRDVGFLTLDETSAVRSAWGALSAGSHPGIPAREEARIGLILALEFAQILLLKFENWKANAYKRFEPM